MRTAAPPLLVVAVIASACWAVTVDRMRGMDMGPGTDLGTLGWFAVVWVTMMAAMMLPSLSPMAVASARGSIVRTTAFVAGYLLPWAVFGLLAYTVVDGVRRLDLDGVGQYVAAGVILSAALYELTGIKRRSLRHCHEPELLRHRLGTTGAVAMGVEQGMFCIACSGALMAALFALGVMSIGWMVLIAALVAIEKLLPWTAVALGATAVTLTLLGLADLVVPGHM
jgi:predicted metal-binding membrane protein